MSFVFLNSFNTSRDFVEQCWRELILGIIQGLTEFLPISSTAHLKVIPLVLGWGDPGVSLTAALQLGSIIAVVFYFRKDLQTVSKGISLGFFENNWLNPKSLLASSIAIGTVPIVLAGFLIKVFWGGYEQSWIRGIPSIAIVSILMALLLFLAERFGQRKRNIEDVNAGDGFFVGIAQILALVPGVSRSGVTLTSALLLGFKRSSAARFSFLLGIPAITLSGLVEIRESFSEFSLVALFPLFIGIFSAAITSWFAIDFLMKFLQRNSTIIFMTYRLIFGVSLLVWYLTIKSV